MKTKHFPILLLAAVALLSGCNNDDLPGNGQGIYDPAKVVTFTTASIGSRGTPVEDKSELTDMGVFSSATGTTDWAAGNASNKMFNRKLNYNISGAWEYDGTPVKWEPVTAADRYTFFAYAPYATGTGSTGNGIVVNGTAATAGIPTLTYTVPTVCANQPDLMVAVPQYNLRHTGAPVSLNMKHALTCVGFNVAGQGEKITGISVEGISMTGTLKVDGSGTIAWSSTGPQTTTNFPSLLDPAKLTSGWYEADATLTGITAANGYLMMIPQTLQPGAKVKITFDSGDPVEIALNGKGNWEAGKRVIYSVTLVPGGTISITPDNISLPYVASSGQFTIACEDGDGNDVTDMPWTLTSSETWLTLSLDPAGATKVTTLNGTGTQTVYVFATANGTTTATPSRAALITMDGSTQVTVTQLNNPGTISGAGTPLPDTYVGAFWRSTQKGERVIKIANISADNAGAWTASVYEMDTQWGTDKIILAPGYGLSETILYTASPGDAESYPVEGNATVVTGTVATGGDIVFRMGLDLSSGANPNVWDEYNEATKPARYAVVLLSYKDNTMHQKLYLRQGEGPDELVAGSGVKWSAFNLKHSDDPTPTTGRLTISAGKAAFTDYPTQMGNLFVRNNLHAYPTWGAVDTYGRAGADGAYDIALDVCALLPGASYHIPSYMNSNTLTASPPNSMMGKYSDGWYDRHNPGLTAQRVVCAASPSTASAGTIITVPAGLRSLFTPSTPVLSTDSGDIAWRDIYYWTLLCQSPGTLILSYVIGSSPYVGATSFGSDSDWYAYGASAARCVRSTP